MIVAILENRATLKSASLRIRRGDARREFVVNSPRVKCHFSIEKGREAFNTERAAGHKVARRSLTLKRSHTAIVVTNALQRRARRALPPALPLLTPGFVNESPAYTH